MRTKTKRGVEACRDVDAARARQYPTRRIYMLESMQPSLDVTGGPWYTNNDLDTDFIATLQKVAIKYIRDNVSRCRPGRRCNVVS